MKKIFKLFFVLSLVFTMGTVQAVTEKDQTDCETVLNNNKRGKTKGNSDNGDKDQKKQNTGKQQ